MHGDHFGTEGHALAEARTFDAAAQVKVIEDLHRRRLKAAQFAIDRRADEVESADADCVAQRGGLGYAPRAHSPEAYHLQVCEEHSLTASFVDGGRQQDEVIGIGGNCLSECPADCIGSEDHVRVGEKEVVGLGFEGGHRVIGGERHGVVLAQPVGRQFLDVKDCETGACERVHDRAGPVRRAVVDRKDMQVGVVLREQRLEACGDVGRFIARGDDDGDRRGVCWGSIVLGC